jgi:uncharacterized surface protein with fasciclin (FAS1) repeats
MSYELSDGQKIETVLGQNLTVTITSEGVFINEAQVTVADIEAYNGVVHVIDAVLVPTFKTVADIVIESDDHTTLEAALGAADLVETLQGEGPFTVFAPTDAAFTALPEGTIDALLADPAGDLTDILLYHVVADKVMSGDLTNFMTAVTINGKEIQVRINEDGVYINNAKVTLADIEATNGVVHVIDAVLLPASDVQLHETEDYGTIMADAFGNTLYFFTKDADGTSMCVDGCLDNWPVFYVENPELATGLDTADFGTIDRGDGQMQTTYKGWPLYYFVNDAVPGQINGDGVIGKWFVAKPNYTIMLIDDQLTGNDGVDYKGDYTEGEEITQYFTDAEGLTLYTWVNDYYRDNKFTAEDFSNNSVWPIYEEENIVVPSILNPDDFSVIDVYGMKQLVYKGWPLYYFGQDMEMRGSNKGVSVPSPGIWPVAVQDMDEAPYEFTTVVDIATSNDDFSILVSALTREDLTIDFVGILSGEGPFTVFAPTNDAFAALLAELGVSSLAEIDSATLEAVLQMHVLNGKVMSTDLMEGMTATTLLGEEIMFSLEGGATITDPNGRVSNITAVDLVAQNGVVHVIDTVILPEQTATNIEDFEEMTMNFYPNPAVDRITVQSDEIGGTIRLIDISGKLLLEKQVRQYSQPVELNGIKSGVYFISLQNGNSLITKKLIVR